ncbi:hypothetical protein [Novosphingobium olei]|uniref:Uncharacterized protein n=1 Tax=Novosphingobium olei TaxID=2728851 RepID=A0A7Y0BRR5_9SPHN|nr:hypothetical protein [Novosphingobium olei]NML95110.1 hypothetical protein [Novosphingobium olei]
MSQARRRFLELLPAPLAAPEVPALRWARLSLLAALTLLGAITLFWDDLVVVAGIVAAGLAAALIAYIVVLLPFWLIAKHKADAAWLDRVTRKDDVSSDRETR